MFFDRKTAEGLQIQN